MALLIATRHNHPEIVELLLSRPETDVNLQDKAGWTALMKASFEGYTEIVKSLLSKPESSAGQRLDINIQSENGRTALMRASWEGYIEIVKLLISRPELDVNLQNEAGCTALMGASWFGYTKIVKLLLSRSESIYTSMSETLTRSASPRLDVNLQDRDGDSALIRASYCGYAEIVELLLSRPEIDVNLQNRYGNSALIEASRQGCTKVVKLLLSRSESIYTSMSETLTRSASPRLDVNLQDKDGRTALMWASWKGLTEIVSLLENHRQI